MSSVSIDLDEELAGLLQSINQTVEKTVREMLVLELYRRSAISSGKGAELLGMTRQAFIHHATSLGIPYLEMSPDEWKAERDASLEL